MERRLFASALGALACLIITACSSAAATAVHCGSTEECLAAVQRAQQDTRTLSAAFVQTKHLSLLDEPIVSTGKFVFKQPDRVRLDIETPQPATVVITSKGIRIPNLPERDRQAMAMAPTGAAFGQLGAIFSGSPQTLKQSFEITAREQGGDIQMTLVPRDASWKQTFHSVELAFAGPELLVRQIRIEDGLGDHLEIELHDVRRNVDVPDSRFELEQP